MLYSCPPENYRHGGNCWRSGSGRSMRKSCRRSGSRVAALMLLALVAVFSYSLVRIFVIRALKAVIVMLLESCRDFLIFSDLRLLSEPPHSGQRHARPYTMWPQFGQVMRTEFFIISMSARYLKYKVGRVYNGGLAIPASWFTSVCVVRVRCPPRTDRHMARLLPGWEVISTPVAAGRTRYTGT